METTYKFSAYNTESLYGYGVEEDAIAYLAWLNQFAQTKYWEMETASPAVEFGDDDEIFHLSDAVVEIEALA